MPKVPPASVEAELRPWLGTAVPRWGRECSPWDSRGPGPRTG